MAGNAAMAAGEAEAALPEFERAEQDANVAGEARMRAGFAIDRARALVATGKPELAVAALTTARESDPSNARARSNTLPTLLRAIRRSVSKPA